MDKPPYSISGRILHSISTISQQIGELRAIHLDKLPNALQRENRIRTIHASLEIEGNTLTLQQITAVLDGKRVIANSKEIREAQNAAKVYDRLAQWKPFELPSLLRAHGMLMNGLVETPGRFRSSAVGIVRGRKISHLAPPAERVPALLKNLVDYAATDGDPLLIKSCVFHYEFEFIHPFTDGNGRMGRLWQTVLLRQVARVFEYLPVEPLIQANRQAYYEALSCSDKEGHATPFVEFMLEIMEQALCSLFSARPASMTGVDRVRHFLETTGNNGFTRQDYMKFFLAISAATASRDLKSAVDQGLLAKSGEKRTTRYRARPEGR